MSDEIIDVNAEEVVGPSETTGKDGINIPDPEVVSEVDADDMSAFQQAREDAAALPQFPTEWQQDYPSDDSGFETEKPKVTATIKQDEVNKLIKKYKRYMKSNLKEIRRVDS